MKITRKQLRQLIKEEIQHVNENKNPTVEKISSDFRDMIKKINDTFDHGFSGDWGNLDINFPDESFDNTGPDSRDSILGHVNKIKPDSNGCGYFGSKVMALGRLMGGLEMGRQKK